MDKFSVQVTREQLEVLIKDAENRHDDVDRAYFIAVHDVLARDVQAQWDRENGH